MTELVRKIELREITKTRHEVLLKGEEGPKKNELSFKTTPLAMSEISFCFMGRKLTDDKGYVLENVRKEFVDVVKERLGQKSEIAKILNDSKFRIRLG
jgi:hypothetical protein